MRGLGVSNLAWAPEAEARALAVLGELGVDGVEVAPTRIAGWDELAPSRLAAFRAGCDAAGLHVSSLQAIFFGRPDCALLDGTDRFEAMCTHTERLADVAATLGAGIAVFGAPRSRLRVGLPPNDAMDLAVERFARLGAIAAGGGLSLGIEPVPPVYGADFLNHASEVIELVRRCDHPNIRAHLDTACVSLAGDDPADAVRAAGPLLAHYHVAEPDLGPFASPRLDHDPAGQALRETGYGGWIVIEMKQGEGDGLAQLAPAVTLARRAYLGERPAP